MVLVISEDDAAEDDLTGVHELVPEDAGHTYHTAYPAMIKIWRNAPFTKI